jgi:ferritin-like metal-binding protein YciE
MLYQTLKSLLDLQLQEIYAVELHLTREIKHYIDGAVSSELRSQLLKHSAETERHVKELSDLLQKRDLDPQEAKCRSVDALLRKGSDIIQSRGIDMLLDLGLVLTMRTIDTLEQRAYEDAKTIAEALGEDEVVKVLESHLLEEGQQECSWTVLAEDMVDELVSVASRTRRESEEGVEGVQ